jgi:hypothetical protein
MVMFSCCAFPLFFFVLFCFILLSCRATHWIPHFHDPSTSFLFFSFFFRLSLVFFPLWTLTCADVETVVVQQHKHQHPSFTAGLWYNCTVLYCNVLCELNLDSCDEDPLHVCATTRVEDKSVCLFMK